MLYDRLKSRHTIQKASKEYLAVLHLAATEGESLVDKALETLLGLGGSISSPEVKMIVCGWKASVPPRTEVHIDKVDLSSYDGLLGQKEAM
jgi:hypothetical protein